MVPNIFIVLSGIVVLICLIIVVMQLVDKIDV